MKIVLQQISKLAIPLTEHNFTDEQKQSGWLGYAPAMETAIEATENRLGVVLPEDYKDFIRITNGFFTPTDTTEPTFESIDKIDYLKNIDSFLLEVYGDPILIDIGRELARSILVAGLADEQYFLLIPPLHSSNKWKYWKFASWIPGEQLYDDLEGYFDAVLDFLKSWHEDY